MEGLPTARIILQLRPILLSPARMRKYDSYISHLVRLKVSLRSFPRCRVQGLVGNIGPGQCQGSTHPCSLKSRSREYLENGLHVHIGLAIGTCMHWSIRPQNLRSMHVLSR